MGRIHFRLQEEGRRSIPRLQGLGFFVESWVWGGVGWGLEIIGFERICLGFQGSGVALREHSSLDMVLRGWCLEVLNNAASEKPLLCGVLGLSISSSDVGFSRCIN